MPNHRQDNLPHHWLWQLAVALLYLLFGLLIHRYILSQGIVSVFWPSSGVGLAALLIGGQRYTWGVLLGALMLNGIANDSLWAIGGITAANVLEARLGYWLITRRRQNESYLDSLPAYLRLVTLGGLASVCAAVIGPLSLLLAGAFGPADLSKNMLVWWMGDALGIVLITPLLLAWWQEKSTPISGKPWLEGFLMLGITLVVGQVIFLDCFQNYLAFTDTPKGYVLFLFTAFVALRLGPRGTTLAIAAIAIQALAGAYQLTGFFANDIARAGLSNYWAYMLTLAIVSMAITSSVQANRKALSALKLKDTALNVAANGVIITNVSGRIEWSNHEFAQVTGYSPSEIYGQNPGALVNSGMQDKSYYKSMWKTILAGQVWRGEIVNRRKDGSLYDEEMTITPMRDERNVITHFVAVKQDISERIHARKYEQYRGEVLELLAGDAPLASILNAIVMGAQGINPAMICSVLLLDEKSQRLGQAVAPSLPDFYNTAIEGLNIGIGVGSCGTAAFTGERVIVEDIQSHPYWTLYKELATQAGLVSCWSPPIVSSANKVLGTFAIYQRQASSPTLSDIAMIEQSARLASIAIERKQADQKLRESENRMRVIFDTTLDAVVGMDIEGRISDWNAGAVNLFGWSKEQVLGLALDATIVPQQHRQAHKQGLARFLATGETTILGRRTTTTAVRKSGEEFPIEMAVMQLGAGDNYQFAAFIADITERKRVEDLVNQLAFYDALTTLPNRRLLNDRLNQVMTANRRIGHYGAVMFLDLDNFKPLNDTHGHVVGDQLLIEAAKRLKTSVREMDTVARFGGDEFVVLLTDLGMDPVDSKRQAGIVAEKIRSALAAPYTLIASHAGQNELSVCHSCSASIGVVVFTDHQSSQDDILKWADLAMYRAKETGRNAIHFHDSSTR